MMDFAVQGTSPASALYFVFVVLLANMLLLNLILAAVLEGSYDKFESHYDSQIVVFELITNLRRQVNTKRQIGQSAPRYNHLRWQTQSLSMSPDRP